MLTSLIQRLTKLFFNQSMYPLKYRVILMAILAAVLLPLFYCLFMGFSLIESEPSYLIVVAPYFFTISIITILLLPVIVDGYSHWFVTIIFSILTLFIVLSTNIYIYNIYYIVSCISPPARGFFILSILVGYLITHEILEYVYYYVYIVS